MSYDCRLVAIKYAIVKFWEVFYILFLLFCFTVGLLFHLARHVTSRFLAHAFWHREKTRSLRRARQARLARHVFRGVATAWTGVDMSTSFPEVVPEIDANPEHKRVNLYVRALLLLRRPPCWKKTARHARHDARDTHDTSSCAFAINDDGADTLTSDPSHFPNFWIRYWLHGYVVAYWQC